MDNLDFVSVLKLGLVDNGKRLTLTPDEEGFLGEIKPQTAESVAGIANNQSDTGMKIQIAVLISDEEKNNIYGATVDNKKNVTLKANCYCRPDPTKSEDENKAEAVRVQKPLADRVGYLLNIQIKWSEKEKCLHTEYPFNNLRLIRIIGNIVEEYEIAIISQGGRFFLSTKRVYADSIFQNEGQIQSFGKWLMRWPQMLAVLTELIGTGIADLPGYIDMLKVGQMDPKPERFPENNMGRVIWWNDSKGGCGGGAIQTNEGVARVHWSQVAAYPIKQYLIPGHLVQFERLDKPTTTPDRPTTYKWEAYGVSHI